MSLERMRDIARWAAQTGVTDIALLGGEPTLHPQFSEILELLDDSKIPSRRVVTNGGAGFLKLSSTTLKKLTRVNVSVDGHNAGTHNAIRGRDSFKNVQESIARLADLDIPFGLTCTPLNPSVSDVLSLIDLANDASAVEINIHWPSPTGRLRHNALTDPLSCDDWNDIVAAVERTKVRRPNFKIRIQVAHLFSPDLSEPVVCPVQKQSNLQFFPDGRVLSCGLLADTPDLAGHHFSRGRLFQNDNNNEIQLTSSAKGAVCPLRAPSQSKSGNTFSPACIYLRRVVTSKGLGWEGT